jgi:hypothetical protein
MGDYLSVWLYRSIFSVRRGVRIDVLRESLFAFVIITGDAYAILDTDSGGVPPFQLFC